MERRVRLAIATLVRGEVELMSWPVLGPGRPDLDVVEAVARLQLLARRQGCSIRLREVDRGLGELLALVGLGDVGIDVSLRQMGRETEHREEGSVDEVVVPDDPVP